MYCVIPIGIVVFLETTTIYRTFVVTECGSMRAVSYINWR